MSCCLPENCQIEQFIESIFPTQDPKKLNAMATQGQKNGIAMSTVEIFVLISSALMILLSIGGLMVS
jgi:farnesyl-diphosphate farnesyltransferase